MPFSLRHCTRRCARTVSNVGSRSAAARSTSQLSEWAVMYVGKLMYHIAALGSRLTERSSRPRNAAHGPLPTHNSDQAMDDEIAASSVMNDMLDAEASLDTLSLTGPQPRMSRDAPDPGPAFRPAPSPRTMESLTGIEDIDARVILQENSWQLEPDNTRARGMMLLAEKMNNPGLTLSAEESIDVTLAGIQCGLRAKEQMVTGQELLAIVGNTGVGKSLLVNYIHGCTVERVDRVMRVSESSPCTEIATVGHSKKSMTFIPQFVADEDFAYLDCPVSKFGACAAACCIGCKVCNLRASVHHGSILALRLLTACPHLAGLPRQSRSRDQHFQRCQHKEHCHKLERSARHHAHQLQFAQV